MTQMATASLTQLPFTSSTTTKSNNPQQQQQQIHQIPSQFSPKLPTTNQPLHLHVHVHSHSHIKTHHENPIIKQQERFPRREFIKGLSLIPVVDAVLLPTKPLPSLAKEIEVGSYLPPSPSDPSFVLFKASSKDTPALRAGNVAPYQFVLPPTWKQLRIANILSGNYCQPKCAEPWIEVKFEDDKQGKIQVVASPLIRLTNKPNASIEDIGSPEKLISSLGPFVTGNTLDPDELLEASVEKIGDQTYYKYVLETPYAQTGTHNLAKATAKGNTVVLFVASASDKQWQTSQKTLQTILDSFQV